MCLTALVKGAFLCSFYYFLKNSCLFIFSNSYTSTMNRIDAHQHFWKFDPVRDSWITDEMEMIQRDFLPEDIQSLLKQNGFNGCVAIQSDQSEAETIFHLENAEKFDFIKGVVGWIDLQSENIEERLQYYSRFNKLKGFRHILQGEARRDLMLQPSFLNGISLLKKYNFTYDILIFQDQLHYISKLVSLFPQQRFVLDHLAKPNIKSGEIEEWEKEIKRVSQFENLYCKISGMVTEADWKNWRKQDFKPYLDVIVGSFGTSRIMFGSDWPVCLMAATYNEVAAVAEDYFSSFSKDEQDRFFGKNAAVFYNL